MDTKFYSYKEYWITIKERKKLMRFLKPHRNCENVGLEFNNSSGIGVTTIVRCLDCGKEENITDHSVW